MDLKALSPLYVQPPPARLTFLYSAFQTRRLANPPGFTAALAWWTALLIKQAEAAGDPAITVDEPWKEAFSWVGVGRPAALGVVIVELATSRQLVPLAEYLAGTSPPSHSLPVSALYWTFGALKSAVFGAPSLDAAEEEKQAWARAKREKDWVFPQLVDKLLVEPAEKKLETRLQDPLARLFTRTTLAQFLNSSEQELEDEDDVSLVVAPLASTSSKESAAPRWTERKVQILLQALKAKGAVVVDDQAIKFTPPAASSSPITETDHQLLSLRLSLRASRTRLARLYARLSFLQSRAAASVATNDKPAALRALREKKEVSTRAGEEEQRRERLLEIWRSLERALASADTVRSLESGNEALRAVLAAPELNLDRVTRVQEEFDGLQIAAQEVDEAVKDIGRGAADIDESELEEELKGLVEEKEREEEQKRLDNLPAVPKDAVSTPTVVKAADSTVEGTEQREPPAVEQKREAEPALS